MEMAERLRSRRSPVEADGQPRNLVLVDALDLRSAGEPEAIRVLIAHGDKLGRAGLRALLEAEPDVAVAGSAADGPEAVALAGQLRPDVLLIDIGVPGVDAVTVTQQLVADPNTAAVAVLILGAPGPDEEIFPPLRAGAQGFLSRDVEPTALIDGIRAVAAGEVALSPSGVRRVIDELASQPAPEMPSPEQLEELTAREREVLALVAAGLSNDEIAERLVVARATAKTHVSRVMVKLCARHRAQLVTLAYETGLVLPRGSTTRFPVASETLTAA
jgi:DNA-binding NarL/FixJ family response regulator